MRNTALLYFRMALMMCINLYTSRVVLQVLGVEDYGIFYVVWGLVYILNFINARKIISFTPIHGLNYRQHLRAVGVFFAMACATTVYTHLDTLMLGFITTNTDVGYYNAAVRVKTILVSIVTSLGAVLLPRAGRGGGPDRPAAPARCPRSRGHPPDHSL